MDRSSLASDVERYRLVPHARPRRRRRHEGDVRPPPGARPLPDPRRPDRACAAWTSARWTASGRSRWSAAARPRWSRPTSPIPTSSTGRRCGASGSPPELDETKGDRFALVHEGARLKRRARRAVGLRARHRPRRVRPRLLRRPAGAPQGPDHRDPAHPQRLRGQRDHLQPDQRVPLRRGRALVEFDGIDEFQWWLLSEAAMERMMRAVGFERGRGRPVVRAAGHGRRRVEGPARHHARLRLAAAAHPPERVVREPEALVALAVVLELRVALEEVPVGAQRAGPACRRKNQISSITPSWLSSRLPGVTSGRVQLELLRHVVAVVVAVEDHHHRAVGRLGRLPDAARRSRGRWSCRRGTSIRGCSSSWCLFTMSIVMTRPVPSRSISCA